MSELLKVLSAYLRDARNPDIHVISGREWTDEETVRSDAVPKKRGAKLVDPKGSVDGVSVGDSADVIGGKLAFFMDGIERMHVPLFCSMVPVVYGYVAAAIRVRGDDRRMCKHAHEAREGLYFPHRLVDPSVFAAPGVQVYDIETENQPVEEHPIIIREAARLAISKRRGRLEKEMVGRWLEEHDGDDRWLVVDGSLGGTLGGDYRKYESPNIIGIIKSHQTQYFPLEDQRKILNLKPGERSGVFVPLGREGRAPVYSWYLRMRPNAGQDVYFGLIRVEAPGTDRTLEMADEISRRLLAERAPLSLPDSRWDKMIYPIRDCEMYLKSLAPARTVLEASMISLAT
jgi:hypothetical protein